MTPTMLMLIPLVDPACGVDLVNPACAAALFREGWPDRDVRIWANLTVQLSPHWLKTIVLERVN